MNPVKVTIQNYAAAVHLDSISILIASANSVAKTVYDAVLKKPVISVLRPRSNKQTVAVHDAKETVRSVPKMI